MRSLLFVVASLLVSISPFAQPKGHSDKSKTAEKALLETDKAFCDMALKEGAGKAFIFYADDAVIKMRNKQQPIVGKGALIGAMAGDSSTALSWSPLYAACSDDGTLGYTFGEYQFRTSPAAATVYGNYFTIWKRQKNGTYRYVLDGGGPTPGRVALEQSPGPVR